MKKILFAVALIAAFSSCRMRAQQPQGAFSADARAEHIPNLGKQIAELKKYHDCACSCGCYAHDLDSQAEKAIAFLRSAASRTTSEKLAIVLDIDETSLSNYQEIVAEGFVFNKQAFEAWMDSAQAPAIPGTLRLDQEAKRLGVAVFFVTARSNSKRAVTETNLRLQGFQWQELILPPESALKTSSGEYKASARAHIAAEGYKIILNVGDQWSDLADAPEAEFSVKYPNPYYLIE